MARRWFLSHAVLGTLLMYALLALAIWRLLLERSAMVARTRSGYCVIAVVILSALLYQGRTGGELVYDHGAGMNTRTLAPSNESIH
jgi:uncharacterized membrane protein